MVYSDDPSLAGHVAFEIGKFFKIYFNLERLLTYIALYLRS